MDFYVYSQDGLTSELLGVIDTSKYTTGTCRALSAIGNHKINSLSTLTINIPADHELNSKITDTSRIVFLDTYGKPQEYYVSEIYDSHSIDGLTRELYCEHGSIEFNDDIITKGMVVQSGNLSTNPADYLEYILSFTRYTVGTVDSSLKQSRWNEMQTKLVGKSVTEALAMFIEKYECELEYVYTMTGNKITGRTVNVKKQIGRSLGKRFEYEKDINSLTRKISTASVKTAIFPRIRHTNQETNEEEFIDISSVTWSTSAGNPVNKPAGDIVLVNSTLSNIYRRLDNGTLKDRMMYAEWDDTTCSGAEALIGQAWALLCTRAVPHVTYEVEAVDLYLLTGDESLSHEHVCLGDTCAVIDRAFPAPIEVSTRVVEVTEDYLDPSNNTFVLGNVRETIATSNVNEQLSVEEQLAALKSQVNGVTIPEYKTPFQGGSDYYQSIKENVQSAFMAASGYTFISDSEGVWVFDKPADGVPTKATIVKGGCIALAQYNTQTSSWDVGTFIDGMSVNADFINTGTLSADRIAAGSITANHLSATAVEYIRTGMATNDDLQNVADNIASIQSDISTINNEITTINDTISEAMAGTLDASEAAVIRDKLKQLEVEYNALKARANKVYANTYLPAGSTPKTNLNSKIGAYTTAYNNYVNTVNSIIADDAVTEAERTEYSNVNSSYKSATVDLQNAIEDANEAILANVYAQAREGLVTTAELQVNNDSVIASAKQGMVTTEDLTSAITMATSDLVNTEDMDNAIDAATADLINTEELTGEVTAAKISSIQESYKAITTSYKNLNKNATVLYGNSYLSGTAKTNLKTASDDYTSKYNALTTAVNNIVNNNSLDTSYVNAYNTAITNLQNATTTLAQRMKEAEAAINTAIYDSSKKYADGLKTALDADINDVSESVTTLRTDINTSIKDGIISEAEAMSIKSNIQILNAEKADIDQEKNSLYENPLLTGTAKDNLQNKKAAYNTAHTNLINVISNAIADNAIDSSERLNIEASFSAYNTALAEYRAAAQAAIDAIMNAKATTIANNTVNNISLGTKNEWRFGDFDGVAPSPITLSNGEIVELEDGNPTGMKYAFHSTSTNSKVVFKWHPNYSKVPVGKKYTMSCWIKYTGVEIGTNSWNGLNVFKHALVYKKTDGTETSTDYTTLKQYTGTSDWIYVSAVVTYKGSSDDVTDMKTSINCGLENAAAGEFWITAIQIREGNVTSTGFSKAEEDYSDAINNAVADLASISDVETAENNAVLAAKIESIIQSYKAITTEYKNNKKQADTLYANTYLDGTAKTNLNSAKSNYTTKYNALTTAYNNIASDRTLSLDEQGAWNSAVSNLQVATTTLAQRMQEANTYINTAVYNASKTYTDEAIPDALTGYATESYVDSAKAAAIADAQDGMVSTATLETNVNAILMTTASMGQSNILYNTDFRNEFDHWVAWGSNDTHLKKIVKGVTTSYGGSMSGENNLLLYGVSGTATGDTSYGVYQDTTGCSVGVSYTLGYWVNCSSCTIKVLIESYDSDNAMSVLASKSYSKIQGNHNRTSWKYDSMTFTVPTGSVKIRVVLSVVSVSAAEFRAWLVKPMLTTGINAQTWSGNPDEIYVGVVSVTEERGIMVEHSGNNTYSTLDATGVKVWEYENNTPIASFGEGGVARIDTLEVNNILCDRVIPVIRLDENITLYFSASGSGDFSGKNSSNCCRGFSGAMSRFCDLVGLPEYYNQGNFFISGKEKQLTLYSVGSTLSDDIYLHNIDGDGTIYISLDKSCTHYGNIEFSAIKCHLKIDGNRTANGNTNDGCILKRTSAGYAIKFYYCTDVTLWHIRMNSTTREGAGILMFHTDIYLVNVDVYNFYYGMQLYQGSRVHIYNCRGTVSKAMVNDCSFVMSEGWWFNADTVQYHSGCYVNGPNGTTRTASMQGAAPAVTNKTVTTTMAATNYQSVRSYTISDLYQSCWTTDAQYGSYVGQIYFNGLKNWLSNASSISAQIYLQRQSGNHGYYTGQKVYINSTYVGTLDLGQGKWFNVPSNVMAGLKDGSISYISLNGTGTTCYIKFEKNVKIRVTATKAV